MGRRFGEPGSEEGLADLLGRLDGLSIELEKAGLTSYESRCYLAAVAIDGGRAEEIAELAMVPRTSAYKALESLSNRGFVELTDERPRRFVATDPIALLARLRGDLESTFDEIAKLQEDLAYRGVPQIIYTLSGRNRVLRKIGEMIKKSRVRLIVSSPNISLIRREHRKLFERALDREVEILVAAPPFVRIPACTSAVRRRSLIATDLVMDGEEALIAGPDLGACGFTDNALLAGHLEGFLEIVMSEGWKDESI